MSAERVNLALRAADEPHASFLPAEIKVLADAVRGVQQLVKDEEQYSAELDCTDITISIPNKAGSEFIERLFDALAFVVETETDSVAERDWDPFMVSVRNPVMTPVTLIKRALEGRGRS